MSNFPVLLRFVAIVGMLSVVSGCATSRGVLDVQIPEVADPQSRSVVVITKVTDARVFEAKPTSPSTPSLKGGVIDDPAITSRAIARKRNGYGKALGDVLLPEGRTIADLVRESVANGLRQKGYSVASTEEASKDAIPLEVVIHKFWAWFTPGFWAAKLSFQAEVDIKGPATLSGNKEMVQGEIELSTQAATTKAWMNTVNKGLENFNTDMQSKLKEP